MRVDLAEERAPVVQHRGRCRHRLRFGALAELFLCVVEPALKVSHLIDQFLSFCSEPLGLAGLELLSAHLELRALLGDLRPLVLEGRVLF
jgi:hypothetical protein